jgi:hypothetical protein
MGDGMRFGEAIRYLVASFDDEQGLSQKTYIATCRLIGNIWGLRAERVFEKYIDCTDGRYHLRAGTLDELFRELDDVKMWFFLPRP